ncbi:MAG: glycoside hydrolase family 3 C-terminal domain-containing protein, partial [Edaphobacter sp.]
KPALTRIDQQVDFDWNAAAPVPEVKASAFGVRWTGTITPPVAGKYEFSFHLANCYPCGAAEMLRVFLDGKQVSEQPVAAKEFRASGMEPFVLDLSDGKSHDLKIEYTHHAPLFGAGISLNWRPPVETQRAEAVNVAKQSDVVIAFVGLSPELEGEEMQVHVEGFDGGDRSEIELPSVQKEMLEAVASTGKPTVVVLMNGSALAVDWAREHAAAVLEAWYPGEEGGEAIANTLAGDNNPAGRLPITFYAGTNELPPFDDYSMTQRTYRYFTGTSLWGFGYGLSYSKFKWSNVKLSAEKLTAGEPLTMDAEVENTSAIRGDAVSEIYLKAPASATAPIHTLVGFVRTPLNGHERQRVRVVIDPRSLSTVAADGTRSIEAGEYSIFVGGAQPGADSGGVTKQFTIVGQKELPR